MIAKRILLGRVGMPHDVARAVLFPYSNDVASITGHALVVDGSLTTADPPRDQTPATRPEV